MKLSPLHGDPTPEAAATKQLFADCQASERKVSKAHIKRELPVILREQLLSRPLFVPSVPGVQGRLLRELSLQERLLQERHPFDFSIPLPVPNMVPSHKLLSQQVSKYLKGLKKMELRWLLVARWLRDEGICQPTDLLSEDVLNKLIKQFRRQNQISVTDVYYTRLIDNWVPYFERLLDALPKPPIKYNLGLPEWLIEKRGYERSAVECIEGRKRIKNSPVSVACEWLVRREDILDIKAEADAATLWNAYSRVHGNQRQNPFKPF